MNHSRRIARRARESIGDLAERSVIADEELHFPFPDSGDAGPSAEFKSNAGRPIIPAILRSGERAQLVCGYNEIKVLLSSDRVSRAAAASHGMTARSAESLALNSADPPDHTRRRRAVAASFTGRRAEQERAWIRRTAADLAAAMAARTPPADLIARFSRPLSVAVICHVMGVPAADFPRFSALADVIMSTAGYSAARIRAAHTQIFGYFAGLYDRELDRLASGDRRGGVLTDLVIAADRDGTLGRAEAIHVAYGLLIAGYETMSSQIAICVSLLLSDRARWQGLRGDLAGLRPAIEEMMRWTSLPATGGAPHVALEDFAIGTQKMHAGQILIPVFAAANRDPRAFDDPDRLRLDRTGASHVAFGHGRHLCLGAPLARVELEEALRALMIGLPELRLDVPAADLRWRRGTFIRGLSALPVRW